MKYGYEGAEKKDLINNYTKSNDKIIIEFLDGNKYEIPLTEKNEGKLLKQMLNQAKDRNDKTSITDIQDDRKEALKMAAQAIGYALLNYILSAYAFPSLKYVDTTFWEIFTAVCASISGIVAIVAGIDYKFYNDEIKELKKYQLYLLMRKKIKNNNNPNLFDGISKKELNINTLDNYTLEELYKLRENLIRCEQYSEYFSEQSDNPTLTKEFGKTC